MHDAGRELFGEGFSFEGVEVAGRIDPAIWHDVARINGIEDPESHHDRFRAAYARHLARRLALENTVRLLPGVARLLEALRDEGGVILGLLTGNYPETGSMKIRAAGVAPELFMVAAWGSDGRCRRDLAEVALRRHQERAGTRPHPARVVLVGDTPHDVDCAASAGFRAIGVATGPFDREALGAAGADLVLDDLRRTRQVLAWIRGAAGPAGTRDG
jgi:phosphoglycolate phosphatase-like HAD superfamily hydrolase